MMVTQQRKRIGMELSTAIARLEGVKKIYYSQLNIDPLEI